MPDSDAPILNGSSLNKLSWIFNATALTIIVSILGFVIDQARQDFLGLAALGLLSVPDYAALTAQMSLDMARTLARFVVNYRFAGAILITLALGVIWLRSHPILRRHAELAKNDKLWYSGALAFFLVPVVVTHLPVSSLDNVLVAINILESELPADGFWSRLSSHVPMTAERTSSATRDLLRDHICYRTSESEHRDLEPFVPCVASEIHERRLENRFVFSVVLIMAGLASLAIGGKMSRNREPGESQEKTGNPERAVEVANGLGIIAVCAAAISVYGMIHVYARTVMSTSANRIAVRYIHEIAQDSIAHRIVVQRSAFMVGLSERHLILFDPCDGKAIYLPEGHVLEIQNRLESVDLLTQRILVLKQRLPSPDSTDVQQGSASNEPATSVQHGCPQLQLPHVVRELGPW
jgi:hypothetical protein